MNQINLESKDAENIGREFLKKLPPNYSWSQTPIEYVVSLENKIFEIDNVLNQCSELIDEGGSKYPGKSYEEGVQDALLWLRGDGLNPLCDSD